MAHASHGRPPRNPARLLACLATACAIPAFAIGLGDMEVASGLGQALDASVALVPGPGEAIARECFTLARGTPGAAPFVTRATLAIETVSGTSRLRIRSTAPVNEPAVTVRVNTACPRGGGLVTRDYVVLLDPQPGRGPMVVAPVVVTRPAPSEAAPAPKPAPIAETKPPVPTPPAAAKTPAPLPAPAGAPKAPAPAPANAASRTLKLSAPEMDLGRTRGVSDQARAQLRERQAAVEAGDPLSALLALRGNMKVLEERVAQLQLKISTMDSAAAAAPKAEVTKPEASPVAKVEPPVAKVEPPPAPKAEAPPTTIEPAPSKAEAPPTTIEPAPSKAEPASKPVATPPGSEGGALPAWLWGVVALLILAIAWIALRLGRRRNAEPAFEPEEPASPEDAILHGASVAHSPPFELDAPAHAAQAVASQAPAQRRTMDSDASLATSVTAGDPSDLRRRYIEERFPEIGAHTIVLEEPDSIVKGARLFYEDGAVTRAVELLQFAVEEKPEELKRWLALFEIFRLERLTGEFAELAARFNDYHGGSEYWAKVQFFGREIDPSNPLYQEESFNDIETIGVPTAAKKLQGLAFDPLFENWLNAPMDFSSEVLATELRQKLLAEAGVSEANLIPNPMSALKSVEMFTVA